MEAGITLSGDILKYIPQKPAAASTPPMIIGQIATAAFVAPDAAVLAFFVPWSR